MPATKFKGHWYVDVRIDIPGEGRRRIRRKSPIQTKKATQAYERDLVRVALSTSTPSVPERRFADFAVEFLENYAVANNKYSEVCTKEVLLRVHLIPAWGHLLLSEIGPAEIEKYKAKKLMTGLKPKTVNNHLTVLRKALVVAQEWGLVTDVPNIKRLKVSKPDFDFLTFDEAKRLVVVADSEWKPMIITALHTGLRLGELLALRWSDVDLVSKRLVVRQAVAMGVVGTPKSGRPREIDLSIPALKTLKAHRHLRGELVFCAEDGAMIRRHNTKHPLHRACRRAELRPIGWHVLRHSFASHLVMRGASIAAVQRLMGHSTIEMTMRYAHLSPAVLNDTVHLLDDVGRYLGDESEGDAEVLEFKGKN